MRKLIDKIGISLVITLSYLVFPCISHFHLWGFSPVVGGKATYPDFALVSEISPRSGKSQGKVTEYESKKSGHLESELLVK